MYILYIYEGFFNRTLALQGKYDSYRHTYNIEMPTILTTKPKILDISFPLAAL